MKNEKVPAAHLKGDFAECPRCGFIDEITGKTQKCRSCGRIFSNTGPGVEGKKP